MYFFPKSSRVQAVQYNGSNDREISDLVDVDKDARPAVWRTSGGDLCVYTDQGNVVALAPDLWVVREAAKIAVMHPDIFERCYLPN